MSAPIVRIVVVLALGLAVAAPAQAQSGQQKPWQVAGVFGFIGNDFGLEFPGDDLALGYGLRLSRTLTSRLGVELQTMLMPVDGADSLQLTIGPRFDILPQIANWKFLRATKVFAYSGAGALKNHDGAVGFFGEFSPALSYGAGIEYRPAAGHGIRFDVGDFLLIDNARWARREHSLEMRMSYVIEF